MHLIRTRFVSKASHMSSFILTLFLLGLATEQSLKAYADPGSGAMFVQILLAAFVGCLFRIRSVVNRFRLWRNKSEHRTFPSLSPDLNNNGLTRPSE
jgi:hypothetical protein